MRKADFLSLINYVVMSAGILLTCIHSSAAQDFAGVRTGKYFGINGAYFNPAAIAGSPYRFDVNLISLNPTAGNNKVAYSLDDLANTFNSDSLENIVFGGEGGRASGMLNVNIHGPSFMFNASAKTAFAFTTRVRYMTNVTDLDGKLFEKLSGDFENNGDLPYTISSSNNMRVNVNAWSEIGASMAHVFMDRGGRLLKAGITVKYLLGSVGTYVGVNRLGGTLTTSPDDPAAQEVYLQNASGQVGIGSAGVDLSNIEIDELLKAKGRGFGGDIGFIYEYRPSSASYDSMTFLSFNQSPYKFRISFSLLDIGSLSYHGEAQSGAYDINITGDEKLDLEELGDQSLHDYNTFFDQKPQYFTPAKGNSTTGYKMVLPATLLAAIDYSLTKRLYLNLEGRVALSGGNSAPSNNYYYNTISLTPRFEGRSFGVYLPIGFNKLTRFNAGFALRAGPLFVGSGSVLTALLGKSKQADFFLGIHILSLHK